VREALVWKTVKNALPGLLDVIESELDSNADRAGDTNSTAPGNDQTD